MMDNLDRIAKKKRKELPRIKQILGIFIGSNDFNMRFMNSVNSELQITPGNELPLNMSPFMIYYHHASKKNFIGIKGGREEQTSNNQYMFGRLLSGELSYLLVDYTDKGGTKYSMIIEVGKTLIDIIMRTQEYRGDDGSIYYSVPVKDIAQAGLIKYSDYDEYKRPIFNPSFGSDSILERYLDSCLKELLEPKLLNRERTLYKEIVKSLYESIFKDYYVPIRYIYEHYFTLERTEKRNRVEEVIWRHMEKSVKKGELLAYKVKGNNVYYWNPDYHILPVPQGNIKEFEEEI